jgi:SAM-dependent methyltransferase
MTDATPVRPVFDPALRGMRCELELAGGQRITLPVARWHREPDAFDELLLGRCTGRTLDIGCGPGRLAGALAARGVPALGVDVSAVAVRLTRRRGATAIRADVFDPLPQEGRWRQVLLADGNIGIGGDPVALLRRARALLGRTGGSLLVELDPPGTGLRRTPARLMADTAANAWFPWARLGLDAVEAAADRASLIVRDTGGLAGRWFAELTRG